MHLAFAGHAQLHAASEQGHCEGVPWERGFLGALAQTTLVCAVGPVPWSNNLEAAWL